MPLRDPEARKAYNREYQQKHYRTPEFRAKRDRQISEWQRTHREASRAISARYRAAHPDRIEAYQRSERFKEVQWKAYLKRCYGITPEQYYDLRNKQDGRCALCTNPFDPLQPNGKPSKGTHIDHDHRTGKIRGMLCGKCNRGIGMFNEDVGLLRKAIEYLERAT